MMHNTYAFMWDCPLLNLSGIVQIYCPFVSSSLHHTLYCALMLCFGLHPSLIYQKLDHWITALERHTVGPNINWLFMSILSTMNWTNAVMTKYVMFALLMYVALPFAVTLTKSSAETNVPSFANPSRESLYCIGLIHLENHSNSL